MIRHTHTLVRESRFKADAWPDKPTSVRLSPVNNDEQEVVNRSSKKSNKWFILSLIIAVNQ